MLMYNYIYIMIYRWEWVDINKAVFIATQRNTFTSVCYYTILTRNTWYQQWTNCDCGKTCKIPTLSLQLGKTKNVLKNDDIT